MAEVETQMFNNLKFKYSTKAVLENFSCWGFLGA